MRSATSDICHLCGASGAVVHEGVSDNLFGVAGEWNIRKCIRADCGLVWLDPKPLEEDLHQAYSHYYTHADAEPLTGKNRFHGPVRRAVRLLEQLWLVVLGLRSARKKIDVMFLGDVAPGRLLEVGCGEGRVLAKLRERGWSVEGQEVDPDAAAHACDAFGLTVHLGGLAELALPGESFDVIVMNHVLEHVHDPTDLLVECRRLLKPGGRLVSISPNPNSYGHRRFGPSWLGLDPPRHLHLFSPAAATRLAEVAGFQECDVWTSAARAGGILAASRDIRQRGKHEMRGRVAPLLVLSAMWYQLTARLAYVFHKQSGEETVLRAR